MQVLHSSCSKQDFEQVLMTCWCIWNWRNSFIWCQKLLPISSTIVFAHSYLQNWWIARSFLHADQEPPSDLPFRANTCWVAPPEGRLKLNVDAAIHAAENRTGYGFIVRDHRGHQVAAQSHSSLGLHQPAVAECVGVREALSWLKLQRLSHVDIETDSLVVAAFFQHFYLPFSDFSGLQLVLDDYKFLLEQLVDVLISFIPRSANYVAHTLAQATNSESGISIWDSLPSPFLYAALAAEFV